MSRLREIKPEFAHLYSQENARSEDEEMKVQIADGVFKSEIKNTGVEALHHLLKNWGVCFVSPDSTVDQNKVRQLLA